MRKFLFVVIFLCGLCSVQGQQNTPLLNQKNEQAEKKILDKMAKTKNVETVYLSKALLKLANMIPESDLGNLKLKDLSSKLSELAIFSSTQKKSSKNLRKDVEKILKTIHYQTIGSVKKDATEIAIYNRVLINNESVVMIVMEHKNPLGVQVIRLKGAFSWEDLEKITQSIK